MIVGSKCRSNRWLWISLFVGCVLWMIFYPLFCGGGHNSPARITVCRWHLKQLGVVLVMYADHYQGRLPMDSANPTLVGSMRLLGSVTNDATFLYCPSDHRRPGARAEADFAKLTTNNISYSYVPGLIWKQNTNAIVALDRIDATAAGSTWPTNSNHTWQGGNVLYSDGRVQFCTNLPSALKNGYNNEMMLSP